MYFDSVYQNEVPERNKLMLAAENVIRKLKRMERVEYGGFLERAITEVERKEAIFPDIILQPNVCVLVKQWLESKIKLENCCSNLAKKRKNLSNFKEEWDKRWREKDRISKDEETRKAKRRRSKPKLKMTSNWSCKRGPEMEKKNEVETKHSNTK